RAPCVEASETAIEKARAAQTEKSVPTTIKRKTGRGSGIGQLLPPAAQPLHGTGDLVRRRAEAPGPASAGAVEAGDAVDVRRDDVRPVERVDDRTVRVVAPAGRLREAGARVEEDEVGPLADLDRPGGYPQRLGPVRGRHPHDVVGRERPGAETHL